MINTYMIMVLYVVFFKQKTAYEMRISDWSSDVCSSDLAMVPRRITGTQTISGQRYVKYNNASGAEVKKLESSGYYADSYWLAYNNQTFNGKPNIEMRIDAEQKAVRELVPIEKTIADGNKESYKMATNRFKNGRTSGRERENI